MTTRTLGVIMNGVTGRMGHRQHLVRSVLAIKEQGGVALGDGDRVLLRPILVGRSATKLRTLAQAHGIEDWTPSLAEALSDPAAEIYFDAQVTQARVPAVTRAIEAGRHVYVEKPTAEDLAGATGLTRIAREAGVKNGVVQDKLFLPGLRKLKRLIDGGFFGRILSVRGESGYWVFEGDWQEAQRPSWNYRAEDGGGIVLDMFPIAQINSSWCTRVDRDELVEFQVDGTHGSAVAGLRDCRVQHRGGTPKPVWNPDEPADHGFRAQWQQVPDNAVFDNAFKTQWEMFVRHVVEDAPFPHDFAAGAPGVYVAEAGLRSSAEGRRIELEPLDDHT
jgi:predicted dehydrogenase